VVDELGDGSLGERLRSGRVALALVKGELARWSSLHSPIEGRSSELEALEEWDGCGDTRLLEESDRGPCRTSEKVLSE
jgi:hypothetical protein